MKQDCTLISLWGNEKKHNSWDDGDEDGGLWGWNWKPGKEHSSIVGKSGDAFSCSWGKNTTM